MLKVKFVLLLGLTILGLVSCPGGDPMDTPQSASIKAVVGSVTASPFVLEVSVIYQGGFGSTQTKVELLDGAQVVSTATQIQSVDPYNGTLKFSGSITLTKTDNGTKSYKARVSWTDAVTKQTKQLESAVSQVTVALP
jgi:hypothetical protein